MTAYVIDASMALAWLLPDETTARAMTVRTAVEEGAGAWIPAHWWLEIGNALLMAERRGRITPEQAARALTLVNALPLEEDGDTAEQVPGRILALARKHGLTVYAAAYLELAQRRDAVLASFDEQLAKAARKERVAVA